MKSKTCIIIAGPTAVGKTSCAIELAAKLNTSIISFDSRQCYRELGVAVAKPSTADLNRVPHHFINTISIHDLFTAADYERYSIQCIDEIFKDRDVAVLVGGTGLYMKAFCEGFDPIPEVDASIRSSIMNQYKLEGISWLIGALQKEDPEFASGQEMNNPQRMMRALEVMRGLGKSIISFHQGKKIIRSFKIQKIGLELPREILYQNINLRVDQMMEAGLLEEARNLYPLREFNALQTVGYRELFDFFDGKISLDQAVNLIKQNTRNYAKRQLTWFKRDPEFHWLTNGDANPERIVSLLGI